MKILNKTVIASYVDAILTIAKNDPTYKNTIYISETLQGLLDEWDERYVSTLNGAETPKEYVYIKHELDKMNTIAAEAVVAGVTLDFDNDNFVNGMINLLNLVNPNAPHEV